MTAVPAWLLPLADAIPTVKGEHFTRFLPPAEGGRDSAVLALFGEGEDGPDLLLIERAHTMRSHAGQPAFPGGAQDPEDDGPIAAEEDVSVVAIANREEPIAPVDSAIENR